MLGTALALLAGYFGRWVDWIVSRLVELWLCFPPVVLSLILIVGFGVGLGNVILAIILVDWTRFCRVVRSEVLVVRRQDYIDAARLSGFSICAPCCFEFAAVARSHHGAHLELASP